jgi:hypothetical protein
MTINVLQKATRADVRMHPYPHVILEEALPWHTYDELDATFPEELLNSDFANIVNDRGHTRRYLSSRVLEDRKVSTAWLDFFQYHVSDEFYKHVTHNVFADAIQEYYPEQFEAIMDTPSQPRRHVNQVDASMPIVTDCQFVMNNPLPESSTSRTPHLDNPVEIYAALLYMKKRDDDSVGGDLEVWESDEARPDLQGKREAVMSSIRRVGACPYKPNSLVLFLNCRHGVHGVGSITNQSAVRRSINIIGEYGDGRSVFKM